MHRQFRKVICWTSLLAVVALLWPQPAMAAKKVLRMVLNGPVREAPGPGFDLLAALRNEEQKSLYQWVKEIQQAAADDTVVGLALIIEQPEMKAAQAEEFIQTLKDFRAKGKKVYCFMDEGSNLTYLLASAADRITLAENGELAIMGLNAELMYFKGLLDKIGVQADMLHCGAYKSALEPFTRTEPSKEAAENVNWLLDGIYGRWIKLIAEGRKLSEADVKAAVDAAPIYATDALKRKLVDEVSSFEAFTEKVHQEFGSGVEIVKHLKKEDELKVDFENPFAFFQLFSKLMEKTTAPPKPGIGLIYIEGGIMMGKNEPDIFGGGQSAGSTTLRAAFDKARRDESIKAVVVRVDSPGGSALASDIIWKAATRCAKEKPLIVSMGGVAGSGGYYVALPGQTIFAEETTITGSIGVVGGKLVWRDLMNQKLGITFAEFNRGAHAKLMSPNAPWSDSDRAWMQDYMNTVYAQFKGRVTESRGPRVKGDLEALAGGRVYTGQQALEKGLIDKIGGLQDALKLAAEKASLKEYEVYVLPKPLDLVAIFKKLMGEEEEDEYEMDKTAAAIGQFGGLSSHAGDPLMRAVQPLLGDLGTLRQLAPAQAAELFAYLRNLTILNREHVGCFMPPLTTPR